MSEEKLFRTIIHALRHDPWKYGLDLDAEGYVAFDDLMTGLRIDAKRGHHWNPLRSNEWSVLSARVNAVYHRSYEMREPIEVRIHNDRIEIISYPGPDPSIRRDALKSKQFIGRRYRNRRIGEFLKELELTEGILLEEHLKMFHLNIADNSKDYIDLIMARLGRVMKAGKFEKLGDLTLDRTQATLWAMRKKQKWGHRTYNHYVQAVQTFCNWCVTTQRLLTNPVAALERLNNDVDVRRKRRALKPEEVVELIAAARASRKRVESYRGELRARLYLMAYLTGLRRGELASLTSRSFKLDADPPTVRIDAACSKHRREDVLPLHPELVQLLREWLPLLKPAEKLFPGLIRKKTAKMVKRDLARTSIPYVNDDGVADFHAAGRHTYITELLRSGVSLVEAKELARHTDVNMTMKYTHIGLDDRSKAVSTLRVPPALHKNPEVATKGNETSGESALQMRCIFCSAEGHSETSADSEEEPINDKNPGQGQGYVASCHQEAFAVKVEAPGIRSSISTETVTHFGATSCFRTTNPSSS